MASGLWAPQEGTADTVPPARLHKVTIQLLRVTEHAYLALACGSTLLGALHAVAPLSHFLLPSQMAFDGKHKKRERCRPYDRCEDRKEATLASY